MSVLRRAAWGCAGRCALMQPARRAWNGCSALDVNLHPTFPCSLPCTNLPVSAYEARQGALLLKVLQEQPGLLEAVQAAFRHSAVYANPDAVQAEEAQWRQRPANVLVLPLHRTLKAAAKPASILGTALAANFRGTQALQGRQQQHLPGSGVRRQDKPAASGSKPLQRSHQRRTSIASGGSDALRGRKPASGKEQQQLQQRSSIKGGARISGSAPLAQQPAASSQVVLPPGVGLKPVFRIPKIKRPAQDASEQGCSTAGTPAKKSRIM